MQPYQVRSYNPYQRRFYRRWVETPTGTYRLASGWLCFLAFLIDFTIIGFIFTSIAEGLYAQPFYIYAPNALQIWVGSWFLFNICFVGCYQLELALWGATLGHLLLGLRVINPEGEPSKGLKLIKLYIFTNILLLVDAILIGLLFCTPDSIPYISNYAILANFITPLVALLNTIGIFSRHSSFDPKVRRAGLRVICRDKLENRQEVSEFYHLAPIAKRAIAFLIDLVLLIAVEALILGMLYMFFTTVGKHTFYTDRSLYWFDSLVLFVLEVSVFTGLFWLTPIYYLALLAIWGKTPGKYLMRLELIRSDGQPMDGTTVSQRYILSSLIILIIAWVLASLGDYVLKQPASNWDAITSNNSSYISDYLIKSIIFLVVLSLGIWINFIMALITKKRQTLQDLLAHTVVVSKR